MLRKCKVYVDCIKQVSSYSRSNEIQWKRRAVVVGLQLKNRVLLVLANSQNQLPCVSTLCITQYLLGSMKYILFGLVNVPHAGNNNDLLHYST